MSSATLTSGRNDTGEYQELDLTFRVDNLVGGVAIVDYTGEAPDFEVTEALAGQLQDRIETVLDDGGPGLSPLVLWLEGEGLPETSANRYLVIDSEGELLNAETEEQFQSRMDEYGRAENVYQAVQTILFGEEGTTDDFVYSVLLIQFPNERVASAWLQERPDRIRDNPTVFDVKAREELLDGLEIDE